MLGMIEHASGLALRFSPGVGAQNVDVRVAQLEALEVVKVNPKGALVGSVGQGSEEGLFVTNCSGLPQIRTAVKIWHFLISHLVDQIDDVDNLVDAYVGVGEGVSVLVQQGLHVKKEGQARHHVVEVANDVGAPVTQLVGSSHAIVFSVIRAVEQGVGVGVLTVENGVEGDHHLEGVPVVAPQSKQAGEQTDEVLLNVGVVQAKAHVSLDEGAPSAAAGKIKNVSAGLCGFGLLQPGMLSHELGNALSEAPITVYSGRCRNSVGS